MEYARNELGIAGADHAETGDPESRDIVIAPLECALVGEHREIRICDQSISSRAYGARTAVLAS